MVWESKYWKNPLLELADKIEDWEENIDLEDSEFADIEREIIIGFYSIRKLAQSFKLSDKTLDENLNVRIYPNVKKVNLINRFYVHENFDLEAETTQTFNIKYICNQIIHSYIFLIDESKNGGLNGISFTSDYKKNELLYFLKTEEIKRIFRKVGKDYPTKGRMTYNEEKGGYDISIG